MDDAGDRSTALPPGARGTARDPRRVIASHPEPVRRGDHELRSLASTADYRACVALQEETWGEGFSERVAPAILMVSQILGGLAAGAFRDDGTIDGFVFGMTGVRDGRLVHWSDMLAVREALRDSGLGAALKEYQRDVLLGRDVRTVHWTFDPLQSRNAYVNLAKLGAVAPEYVRDMYGDTDSPLHRGIGTDRFVVLWELDSERVRERLADARGARAGSSGRASALRERVREAPAALDGEVDAGGLPRPGEVRLPADAPGLTVAIPADVGVVMRADPALAVAWREATRAALGPLLADGWRATELIRGEGAEAGLSRYLLERS